MQAMRFSYSFLLRTLLLMGTLTPLPGRQLIADKPPVKQAATTRQPNSPRPAFKWVNPRDVSKLPGVEHQMFQSKTMKRAVGYFIYLPPRYKTSKQRMPVVYYLHGGRPGSEAKSVNLAAFVHQAIQQGVIPPTIYVFVNGGPVSHYNLPDRKQAMGEDVFVKELIPHIDATYRTIATRGGRGLEGFSQGGRGTARIMFKHPQLFCSAAPGGGGYATEKQISENDGRENENLKFTAGDNTWDLARNYAERENPPPLKILVFVGNQGFNYENNLQYMEFLQSLQIPFKRMIVEGAPHSAQKIYQKQGQEIMKFHAAAFAAEN